jgi:hypothetical protein
MDCGSTPLEEIPRSFCISDKCCKLCKNVCFPSTYWKCVILLINVWCIEVQLRLVFFFKIEND